MATTFRYIQLADALQTQIEAGAYAPGDKIPGTRTLAKRYGFSINTVLQAQKVLEQRGLIEALSRSGFYVKHGSSEPRADREHVPHPLSQPQLVEEQSLVMNLITAAHSAEVVSLGAALPHSSFFPNDVLRKYLGKSLRQHPNALAHYSFPPGHPNLRASLAKKMIKDGIRCRPDEVVITSGCHDALLLALKAVTQPGDIVALESPTYYGILQALESMQLKALEIPCSDDGISVIELANACEQWPINACILVSNFSNPLGSLMSTQKKQDILTLLAKHKIPLIEDDIYGDLAFSGERPAPMAALSSSTDVIYCNSFSKTLAPGFRVGWIHSARHANKLSHLKFSQSLGAALIEQIALHAYLEDGHYDRHIRQLQRRLSTQVQSATQLIEQHFPVGTTVSRAKGGFVLWLQLAPNFDSYQLYQAALCDGISIAPGRVFSNQNRFSHCLRLNCAQPWAVLEPALMSLALLAKQQSKKLS